MSRIDRSLIAGLLGLALSLCPCTVRAAKGPVVYQVRPGDTLSEIALRYHVTSSQVRRWNELKSDRIVVGQRLRLWPPEEKGRKRGVWHVVREGDTLSEIALWYDTTVRKIRQLNGLKNDTIRPGQRIQVRSEADGEIRRYRVRKGDTLSEIALRYDTTVRKIKALNGLEDDRIRIGSVLRIPPPLPDPEDEVPLEYVVRKGDTLSEIAERFGVGLRLLRRLNHLRKDVIRPGQKLRLRPTASEEGIHIVQQGETLSEIALQYGIPLKKLRELNGIEGSRIFVGQKLRLKTAPAAVHIVERGDALWEIARAYGMSVAELKKLNGLTSDRIYPGQELRISARGPGRFAVYTVRKGDYLGQIARLHQMSVAELKRINHLKGSTIHPGDRLKVRPLLGKDWLEPSEIDWKSLELALEGVPRIQAGNGPYYFSKPRASRQKGRNYYERASRSPLQAYRRARKLWTAFEHRVEKLGRLSRDLEGWRIVLDPGHGGLDPGAIAPTVDGNGKRLYIVEDEYAYDVALRVYVLLRLHGAQVSMTVLSPNHLIRHSQPPTQTFVNEKNEVYNSYRYNKDKGRNAWPSGGNLRTRVRIARSAFSGAAKGRRIFLSFHADIEPRAPDAPLVLYYESRDGRRKDLASRSFARILLPALGAGARMRGQPLGVLRDNPADVKVLFELRNMAYRDQVWALRFEQLRQRDAEKVVKGILDYVHRKSRMALR